MYHVTPPDADLTNDQSLPELAPREQDGHKGDYGHVLVVAGSKGMSGAAALAGTAALRSGAGRVTVATPESAWLPVAISNPCLMTLPLPDDGRRLNLEGLDELLEMARSADVVAIGPGLGQSPDISEIVRQLLAKVAAPIVLDADGLNALGCPPTALLGNPGPRVLTPHPGEFARLIGHSIGEILKRRGPLVRDFVAHYGVVLVLKGPGTLIADKLATFRNTTGNPGMATAGCGDVLTGIIAALIGQGLSPLDAARLGVHTHGSAGDRARDEWGEVSLTAADLLNYLSRAMTPVDEIPF